jgi:hypothetical protein
MMAGHPIPIREGFYWAKLKFVDDGTNFDPEGNHPWEVVNVFENHLNDGEPDQWRVHVPGIEQSQSAENFYWGPGPLTEPGKRAE